LADWSKRPEQKCRFYTVDRDAAGNDKQLYKRLRQAIEGNFYINLRPALSTAPSKTEATSPAEKNRDPADVALDRRIKGICRGC